MVDADELAAARARGAAQRRELDRELIVKMTKQIAILFPGCPPHHAAAIAEHTAVRGSGRVGRTAAGRNLEEPPWPRPLPPRFVTSIPITIRYWRLVWIVLTPGSRWPIRCKRLWKLGGHR